MGKDKIPLWRRILQGNKSADTDEFAADELELNALQDEEEDDDTFDDEEETYEDENEGEGIGESEYFSTCDYTMIPTDDDSINSQGS